MEKYKYISKIENEKIIKKKNNKDICILKENHLKSNNNYNLSINLNKIKRDKKKEQENVRNLNLL